MSESPINQEISMSRIIAAIAIAFGALLSGCATATHEVVTITKTIDKDGKVTEEKKTETKKTAGVVSGAGYYGHNPYYGGYVPRRIYTPGGTPQIDVYQPSVGRLVIKDVYDPAYGRVQSVPRCLYPDGTLAMPMQPGNKC